MAGKASKQEAQIYATHLEQFVVRAVASQARDATQAAELRRPRDQVQNATQVQAVQEYYELVLLELVHLHRTTRGPPVGQER